MQTFLPDPDFYVSARVLDSRRPVCQIKEAKQILDILLTPEKYARARGYLNHPIVNMWRGYERKLAYYGYVCTLEYIHTFNREHLYHPLFIKIVQDGPLVYPNPPWLGNKAFHLSHRRALIAKLPDHYSVHFPNEVGELNYLWYDPNNEQWFRINKHTRKREYTQ